MSPKLGRLAPLAGVLFLVLMALVFFAFPQTPDPDASPAKVLAFWHDHRTSQLWAAWVAGLASVALIWFGASLREMIEGADGGRRLGGLALVGAAIAGLGGLLFSGIGFTAADTAGKVPAEVTLTLNVMNNELFMPLAGGLVVMLAATALASLYWGVLPKWFGWITLVLAVVILTPWGFFGFLATVLWVGIVGGWLYVKDSRAAAG
jgi:hypothetical protein